MKRLFKISSKFHGEGGVTFNWQPCGSFLASAGSNGLVHIFDRQGEQIDEIGLSSSTPVLGLEWDRDGETLAILQEANGVVHLWDMSSRSTHALETGLKDPTFIRWSFTGTQLAIGTQRGNLVLYNKNTRKKVPVIGKHSKTISCGAWNSNDQLALGSTDKMVTFSDSLGNTIAQKELKEKPISMNFGKQKSSSGKTSKNEDSLLAIGLNASIILLSMNDPESPIELSFQSHYGNILSSQWFGDGLLVLSFTAGFVIIISTHPDEMGEEVFSGRFFAQSLHSFCYSASLNRVAISGDSGIKIIDMSNYSEIKSDAIGLSDAEANETSKLAYTKDGQILTVGTKGGVVQNFLARMPNIADHYDTYVAYLSSLREISVVDVLGKDRPIHISVSIEPSFIALGPYHVAVGMNNRVWYYRSDGEGSQSNINVDSLVNEQQYLGTVNTVKLNSDFSAVLCDDGTVSLHTIENSGHGNESERSGVKVFPESLDRGDDGDAVVRIISIAITRDFLIYSTNTGKIQFFYLKSYSLLAGSGYIHQCDNGAPSAIINIFPNERGTRVVFIDERHHGYILNAPLGEAIEIPSFSTSVNNVLWDHVDRGCFVAIQPTEFSVYLYTYLTVHGTQVVQLGSLELQDNGEYIIIPENTTIPSAFSPILIYDGSVSCQKDNGSLSNILACTHTDLKNSTKKLEHEKRALCQNLALLRLEDAYDNGEEINERNCWLAIAGRAMEVLDLCIAKRVYRSLGDAGMVIALERIEQVEDKHLVAGHVLTLFGEYSRAQELFLTSSDPMAALRMQTNLLQWEQALSLANTLSPELIPEISIAFANQLEFKGNFQLALEMYEQACNSIDSNRSNMNTNSLSKSDSNRKYQNLNLPRKGRKAIQQTGMHGIARCTLRLGDLRRGTRLAMEIKDKGLFNDCGGILESMKQTEDAALLYEHGQQFEKAVALYIVMKNLEKAKPLMKKVTMPKLHIQYARAKESAGDFESASNSYENAYDMDNVVRIQLEKLNNPEKAFSIVRKTKSSEGSLAVAKYCEKAGNYQGAIEFLLMANRNDEAFKLAQVQNEMEVFTSVLGENIASDEAMKVGIFYEKKQKWDFAGRFYQICGNYPKALRLYLQCEDRELDKAIDVVGKARNDMLTHTLIDFLMGENDGVPKDPNYIFRLYMALGNYAQAAKTATIIARQEQELGNYKVARDVLFETSQELFRHEIPVSQELRNALVLLHSYLLVKKMVKQGDHESAARLLIRVARNISKFPAHAVNILTSTVIECQRSNLRTASYEFASILMRPEYRSNIEDKFKRKIEAIVRKKGKVSGDSETVEAEKNSPCPHCDKEIPQLELDCLQCKNAIDYCVITGKHMIKSDWSVCPNCKSTALYSAFLSFIKFDETCPMCEKKVNANDVTKLNEKEVAAMLEGKETSPETDEPAPSKKENTMI